MYVEKQFSLYEYLEEETYLNEMAKDGHCLEKVSGEGFQFKDCASQNLVYRVVFSLNDFDQREYDGFTLIDSFASSKGGYYHYLLQESELAVLKPNEDRKYRLENDLGRIERFSGIVISSLMVLFLYLFYTQKNPLYLIIVLAGLILGVYVLKLRRQIIKAIKN